MIYLLSMVRSLTQLSSWTEIQEDQKVSDSLLSSQDSAEKALEMDGKEVEGRKIVVNKAKPQVKA